nr:hypothetical protein [uncultured Acetobacter sp.]
MAQFIVPGGGLPTSTPVGTAGDTLGSMLNKSSGTAVSTLSASGATDLPVPASGNIYYVVNATADAQLQFSGAAAEGQLQTITLEVHANGFTVTLPTTNVVPSDSTLTLPATATQESGFATVISYTARGGSTVIVGGV